MFMDRKRRATAVTRDIRFKVSFEDQRHSPLLTWVQRDRDLHPPSKFKIYNMTHA